MRQKDQKKGKKWIFFLPQAAGSTAKDRERQRTHIAAKGPSYEHHNQLLWDLLFFFSSAFLLHDRRSFFLTGKLETSFSCSKANSTNASSDL